MKDWVVSIRTQKPLSTAEGQMPDAFNKMAKYSVLVEGMSQVISGKHARVVNIVDTELLNILLGTTA